MQLHLFVSPQHFYDSVRPALQSSIHFSSFSITSEQHLAPGKWLQSLTQLNTEL